MDGEMDGPIDLLTSSAEICGENAPLNEKAGDHEQAALERKLAHEYRQAARHLKAVQG